MLVWFAFDNMNYTWKCVASKYMFMCMERPRLGVLTAEVLVVSSARVLHLRG